eukprot:CAMPEP_0185734218 /NCGR_PEP_ID=MMETSP1171-20130828/21828_1 /TAXON_ID=374046 /ORGANISM="Helicotheca tamensis, Strain CCMP826" /LENGTH=37 /DNA_ID= /DNA_START= /DNA_END= /DNA_ORIENTATION=
MGVRAPAAGAVHIPVVGVIAPCPEAEEGATGDDTPPA